MCYDDRQECVPTIEMNKLLENHEHIVGNSWAIFSMVPPRFSGVIVVLSGDVVNSHHSDDLCQRFTKGFFFFFGSGLRGPKAYSLWDGVVPNPSIGYDYL